MKQLIISAVIGTALCGLTLAGAQAQSADQVVKPVTIKLGAFFPSNGNLKDSVGKTWLTAGGDYAFSKQGEGQSLMPLGYVDYAGKSSHGLNASYVGVGGGFRYYTSAPGATTGANPYLGAGIGAYFLHGSANGDSVNKTRFGFKLNAGVEFRQTYLLEATYTNAGSVNGTRLDGFGIQAGVRF